MSELYFAYPAILTTRKDTDDILVEFPDLEIEPFAVPESKRSELFDIVYLPFGETAKERSSSECPVNVRS